MERIDKINYYLDIAETVLKRSTCIRRQFGAVVVKNDEIISTGYNGSPRGRKNCSDIGICIRNRLNIPRGERYELCRSVHAEQNAIISASRNELMGSTIYLACHDASTNAIDGNVEPCSMCRRFIINAGVERVIVRKTNQDFKIINVDDWILNDESLEGINEYGKLN
ncbi:MAG: cytidine/deoxycytidylate deaminase family protein [Ruminococcus sp.]|nr:cytidine/deoxycytidylate deaminase family protein [Ruminococcus sp.]MCD7800981.1 cytidine/deoxycytidylate deaminase family protein [Ruminococcus sp.]